jgi:phosphinothricin acetyltransferase
MAEAINIRLATEVDHTAILDIYAPYVTETSITFENEVPSMAAFDDRIRKIQRKYPWLVCEIDGTVVGYAYASQYKDRAAYDWSVELALYVQHQHQEKKVGRALCAALLEVLRLQGYCNAYACVAMPNPKSEGLFHSFDFKDIGFFENVGYKFGQWHDIKWLGLGLLEHVKSPSAPEGILEVADKPEFCAICDRASQFISEIDCPNCV